VPAFGGRLNAGGVNDGAEKPGAGGLDGDGGVEGLEEGGEEGTVSAAHAVNSAQRSEYKRPRVVPFQSISPTSHPRKCGWRAHGTSRQHYKNATPAKKMVALGP